jgi:lysophospholipase
MVTYGWVAATYDSVDALTGEASKSSPKTPALIAVAGNDQIVSNRAIRRLVAGTDNCSMIEIEDARHEILQEADGRRTAFWQAFDEFLGL